MKNNTQNDGFAINSVWNRKPGDVKDEFITEKLVHEANKGKKQSVIALQWDFQR